jgi:hypothetical protein
MSNDKLKIIIALPRVRMIYPALFEKPIEKKTIKINGEDQIIDIEGKYGAAFILSKDDDKHAKVIQQLAKAESDILKSVGLKKSKYPVLKDNDKMLDEIDTDNADGKEHYDKVSYLRNTITVKGNTNYPPKLELVKDIKLDVDIDANPFYAGCYVNAILELQPYKFDGKWQGVARYLIYVLFSKAGERLGGGKGIDGASYFDDEDEDFTSDAFEDEKLF